MTPEDARAELVRLLDLEPMGGRPDGKATWDDVVAYVAKQGGTLRIAMSTIERRARELVAAAGMPADTPHPRLVERVREGATALSDGDHLVRFVGLLIVDTTRDLSVALGIPHGSLNLPEMIERVRFHRQQVDAAIQTAATTTLLARLKCSRCGHMWNRHGPDYDPGCTVNVEVNHVDGVAQGLEPCRCTDRRPA